MKPVSYITILVAGLLMTAPVQAAAGCSADDADTALTGVHTWPQLYSFYTTYHACSENGSVGEGVSATVSRLLVHHWNGISDIGPQFHKEPALASYIVRHIDLTWNRQDFPPARDNAARHCPPDLGRFCQQVVTVIDDITAHPETY